MGAGMGCRQQPSLLSLPAGVLATEGGSAHLLTWKVGSAKLGWQGGGSGNGRGEAGGGPSAELEAGEKEEEGRLMAEVANAPLSASLPAPQLILGPGACGFWPGVPAPVSCGFQELLALGCGVKPKEGAELVPLPRSSK